MVVRLYGTCQGADVVFQRDEAGTWSCAVPASPTGAYAIQLWAVDEAGNVGYFATILLAFDPNDMRCRIEILDVGTDFALAEVAKMLGLDEMLTHVQDDPVRWAPEREPLRADITEFERCCG